MDLMLNIIKRLVYNIKQLFSESINQSKKQLTSKRNQVKLLGYLQQFNNNILQLGQDEDQYSYYVKFLNNVEKLNLIYLKKMKEDVMPEDIEDLVENLLLFFIKNLMLDIKELNSKSKTQSLVWQVKKIYQENQLKIDFIDIDDIRDQLEDSIDKLLRIAVELYSEHDPARNMLQLTEYGFIELFFNKNIEFLKNIINPLNVHKQEVLENFFFLNTKKMIRAIGLQFVDLHVIQKQQQFEPILGNLRSLENFVSENFVNLINEHNSIFNINPVEFQDAEKNITREIVDLQKKIQAEIININVNHVKSLLNIGFLSIFYADFIPDEVQNQYTAKIQIKNPQKLRKLIEEETSELVEAEGEEMRWSLRLHIFDVFTFVVS